MNKVIYFLLMLTMSFSVFSQKQVSYQFLEKNPDVYKKSLIYVEPFFADLYKGVALGYGVKAEVQVWKFIPWFHYKSAYLDINASSDIVDIKPKEDLYKQRISELGATWIFSDKNKDHKIGMNLSSQKMGGGMVKNTFINIDGTSKVIHGLDFGIFFSKHSMEFEVDIDENVNPDWGYKRVSDGLEVPMYFSTPSGTVQPDGSQWLPATSYQSKTLFVGYRYRNAISTKILAEGYGTKSKKVVFDWYTHLLFSPKPDLKSVFDKRGVEWQIVPLDEKKLYSNFGFRTGILFKAANFLQFYSEIGYKPGPKITSSKTNGIYIGLGWGFFIGSKKGFLLKGYNLSPL